MKQFNIPIALFLFKRAEKTAIIIDQIEKIHPRKLYLIADGPRTPKEKEETDKCRKTVEEHITWNCSVIKNYSEINRGVYENIANGAKWVFSKEPFCIFLEDDNFPELSFFQYCEELLYRYMNDSRILWICGTNYLKEYQPEDNSDYVYTKLMLPCGWASWANKFCKFYDGEMNLYRDKAIREKIKNEYKNKALYHQDKDNYDRVIYEIDNQQRIFSWDYQMAFALRINNLYGIAPKYNQIKNIGADTNSIHGGKSMDIEMTSRFCEIPTKELSFPLKHPKALMIDDKFEKMTERIIVAPIKDRLKYSIINTIKYILRINKQDSLKSHLYQIIHK